MEQTTCLELVLMQNLLLIISFTFELSLKLGIMFSTQFQISMSMRKLCLTHHLLKLKYAKHGSKHIDWHLAQHRSYGLDLIYFSHIRRKYKKKIKMLKLNLILTKTYYCNKSKF